MLFIERLVEGKVSIADWIGSAATFLAALDVSAHADAIYPHIKGSVVSKSKRVTKDKMTILDYAQYSKSLSITDFVDAVDAVVDTESVVYEDRFFDMVSLIAEYGVHTPSVTAAHAIMDGFDEPLVKCLQLANSSQLLKELFPQRYAAMTNVHAQNAGKLLQAEYMDIGLNARWWAQHALSYNGLYAMQVSLSIQAHCSRHAHNEFVAYMPEASKDVPEWANDAVQKFNASTQESDVVELYQMFGRCSWSDILAFTQYLQRGQNVPAYKKFLNVFFAVNDGFLFGEILFDLTHSRVSKFADRERSIKKILEANSKLVWFNTMASRFSIKL